MFRDRDGTALKHEWGDLHHPSIYIYIYIYIYLPFLYMSLNTIQILTLHYYAYRRQPAYHTCESMATWSWDAKKVRKIVNAKSHYTFRYDPQPGFVWLTHWRDGTNTLIRHGKLSFLFTTINSYIDVKMAQNLHTVFSVHNMTTKCT